MALTLLFVVLFIAPALASVGSTCPAAGYGASLCTCSGTSVSCTYASLVAVPCCFSTATTHLDLSNNAISILPGESFASLSALTILSLRFNALTRLTADMFKYITSLTSLFLGSNPIVVIDINAFSALTSLQTLKLTDVTLPCCNLGWLASLGRSLSTTWRTNSGSPTCSHPPVHANALLSSLQYSPICFNEGSCASADNTPAPIVPLVPSFTTALIIGGVTTNVVSSVFLYSSLLNTMTTAPALSVARFSLSATHHQGSVYAIGGLYYSSTAAAAFANNVERYSLTWGNWTSLAPINLARQSLSVVALGNFVYAIAGSSSTGPTNVTERYNPATDTWTFVAPLPVSARSHGAACSLGSFLYYSGGYSVGNPLAVESTVFRYNPASNSWALMAPLSVARYSHAMATFRNTIYAVGGFLTVGGTASVEQYNVITNSWFTVAPLPTAANTFSLVALNGKIYGFGGRDASTTPVRLATGRVYDPVTNTWSQSTSDVVALAAARSGYGLAPLA